MDDTSLGPKNTHQVSDSSLISFSWKKNIEILALKTLLNEYDLATTKTFCAIVGPRNKKQFLNPPMGDMPITKENGLKTSLM